MSTEVLQQARVRYDRATAAYMAERRSGGITELDPLDPDESDEIAAGAKWKARTPVAATVMGFWQRCKAELDAAAANVRRDRGDKSCPTCAKDERGPALPAREPAAGVADRRLPPERDEEAEGLL
jgi:hypothetical protein